MLLTQNSTAAVAQKIKLKTILSSTEVRAVDGSQGPAKNGDQSMTAARGASPLVRIRVEKHHWTSRQTGIRAVDHRSLRGDELGDL
jgi:hypothetical protein